MNELIRVSENEGKQLVSAKELHLLLETQTRFDIWIQRMFEYGFRQNVDYQQLNKFVQTPNGGKREVLDDYVLTLDCAKHISMMQRTPKGQEFRDYFIEVEKKYQSMVANLSPIEMVAIMATKMVAQEKSLKLLETKVHEIDSKLTAIDENYYGLAGYYRLQGRKFDLTDTQAQQMGKCLAANSKANDYPVNKTYHAKHGAVNTYHQDILRAVLGF
jgi:phage anti-repressor protein